MVCMLNRQGTQHHPLVSLDILDIAAFCPWKMLGMFQPSGTQTTHACLSLVHGMHVRAAGHTLRPARRPCQMLGMFQPPGTKTACAFTNEKKYFLGFSFEYSMRDQQTALKAYQTPESILLNSRG